ncbi:MAG TPA: O-antigen ligase family protein [Ktedonobacteraceae bacterium]|nr:O-antigen ligase family protein [Ktedonobacteraceae bacterium]
MNIPGVGEWESIRHDSWLDTIAAVFHSYRSRISPANLVGLIGALLALFMLLALPEPWNVRLPLYLLALVLCMVRPRVALYLMPLAVPWGSLDSIAIGTANLNSADFLVAFLAAGWLLSFVLYPTPTQPLSGPRDHDRLQVPRYFVLATVVLLGVMLISMLVAINLASSLKEIVKWTEFLVIILIGSQYLRTRKQIWALIVLTFLAAITQAFYGYAQYFLNLGPANFLRDASLRVYGTFGQPNPFAGYINMTLVVALALALLGRGWLLRSFAGVTTLILLYVELLTQSRGGEIALAAAIVFIVFIGMPRLRSVFGLLAIGFLGMVGLFLASVLPTSLLLPIAHILGTYQFSFTNPSAQDYSTAERLAHWIAGINMFLTHPILGVGIGNYPDAYPQYYITIFVNSLGHAHNYYINIAAETGIIGLFAFLTFLATMFIMGGSAYRAIHHKYRQVKAQQGMERRMVVPPVGTRQKLYLLLHPPQLTQYYRSQSGQATLFELTNDRALAIGLLASLLTVCVHNLVDDLYVHSMTNLIALLLIALIRLEAVKARPDDDATE